MFFVLWFFSAYGKPSAKLVGFLNTFFTFLFLFAVKNADFHFISFHSLVTCDRQKSLLLCLIKSGIFWENKFKHFCCQLCGFLEEKRTYWISRPFSLNIYFIFFLVGRLIIFLFVLKPHLKLSSDCL
jgi:hypothetical protein